LIPYSALPAVDATLNGICAILLCTGFYFIRRKRIALHRAFMLSACGTSVLFLASYLTYHAHEGTHRYPGRGAARAVYLAILATHTVLAAAIVPLVARVLFLALSARFPEHRKLARWTLPIWLYVSVTGVVVYVMLYH
jgi:putative membrane protein